MGGSFGMARLGAPTEWLTKCSLARFQKDSSRTISATRRIGPALAARHARIAHA